MPSSLRPVPLVGVAQVFESIHLNLHDSQRSELGIIWDAFHVGWTGGSGKSVEFSPIQIVIYPCTLQLSFDQPRKTIEW